MRRARPHSKTKRNKKIESVYTYTAVFEPAREGGYTVTVPDLPGCITEGDTLDEARERVHEAIRGYLEVLQKRSKPLPHGSAQRTAKSFRERVEVLLKV